MKLFNPFPPSMPKWHRLANILILFEEGIIKKFLLSVATMSRLTKRAFLSFLGYVQENDEKKKRIQDEKG